MLSRSEIEEALRARGFVVKVTEHARVLTRDDGLKVALKNDVNEFHRHALVVQPQDWDRVGPPPSGIDVGSLKYHNASLTGFPRRRHTGLTPGPYGVAVGVDDEAALDRLLLALVGTPSAPILDEIDKARPEFDALGPTEREAIVAARLGQGRFRSNVLAAWDNACAVTGAALPGLLRAGHIQRWCDSDNVDRLSAENGIALLASLDAAFESLLLTFDDDGAMRVAPHAEEHLSILLHGTRSPRLRKIPSARQRLFLAEHRKRFTAQNGTGRTAEEILTTTA